MLIYSRAKRPPRSGYVQVAFEEVTPFAQQILFVPVGCSNKAISHKRVLGVTAILSICLAVRYSE